MLDRRSASPPRVAGREGPSREPDGGPSLGGYAATCTDVLGADLTAYVSGVASTAELDEWTRPGFPTGPGALRAAVIRERLRAAVDVIDVFAAANRVSLVRAWLREVGAAGPGLTPAGVLRHSRDESARKRVYEAAELFLSGALPAA